MKILTFLTILCPMYVLAGDFTQISVFGDSLSDCGNKFAVSHQFNSATEGALLASTSVPNWQGRASNGWVWTEYLAQLLELPPLSPARIEINTDIHVEKLNEKISYFIHLKSQKGNNWSVGGAMALPGNFNNLSKGEGVLSFTGGNILPNSSAQISNRINEKGFFDKGTIVTYMLGTNNMWYSLYGDLDQTGPQAAKLAASDINHLIQYHAETIVIANIPDLSDAPWLRDKAHKADEFINSFNRILKERVRLIEQANPSKNIIYVDAYAFYKKIKNEVLDSGVYEDKELNIKITNIKDASFQVEKGKVIGNPEQFLYWDGIHPTTNIHKLYAKYVANAIQNSYWNERSSELTANSV
ncbi:SGNH/GDSL hydrolase family protein [Vibrio hepatarius]|uniref:SGNH/GDSL hydrolase family protein n=1 Tax=Vibrio hepatarius TaxID=171383 RepID=UPI001C09B1BD|nr:SGNH/GDSL hydrolase family protein [Vibrio hepatarius]MBU2899104.1 hypothetical protein [Vibrio hepatarius]